MKKIVLFVVVVFFLFPVFGGNADLIVYKTKTGSKYHLGGCSSLSRSKTAITLEEAVISGLSPCLKCSPPTLDALQSIYRVNVENLFSCDQADISQMLRATVERVVDGDTIGVLVANAQSGFSKKETIWLLGVNTPETVHPSKSVEHFGREASDFTKTLMGQTIYLAFDWDLRDTYGRLLAYVYTENGKCFNAQIIEEGFGFAYLTYPFQFMEEFKELEKRARVREKGFWN